MTKSERFARLFRGYTQRYGRYDISDEQIIGGKKVQGVAQTVSEELRIDSYITHLKGEVGIGVIPLTHDNLVHFAAIDIDLYKREDQQLKKLTHEDVALLLFETPLVVTKSKSSGIHVWLFSEKGVPAQLAVDYLKTKSSELGASGSEIFPKQTKRLSKDDVGNWINLPYFGKKRLCVFPVYNEDTKKYTYIDLKTTEFLDVAEGCAKKVTTEWLEDQNKLPVSQRGNSSKSELWFDGPPCLQKLIAGEPHKEKAIHARFNKGEITNDQYRKQLAAIKPQLEDGGRNNAFLNVGIYLRRRLNEHDPDAVLDREGTASLIDEIETVHGNWRVETGNSGIKSEIRLIGRQAAKGKWGYSCSKEPLQSNCDRRLCLKRKFGIGTAINDVAQDITGFTIINTKEKQYYMNIGDYRVYVPNTSALLSQARFMEIVVNATNRMWKKMQESQYSDLMDKLLKDADIIEGPADSDHESIILDALVEFIHSKKQQRGKNDNAFFTGRVIISKDGKEAWLKLSQFVDFLRSRGYRKEQYENRSVAYTLRHVFNFRSKSTTVANKSTKVYIVDLEALDNMVEFDIDNEESNKINSN